MGVLPEGCGGGRANVGKAQEPKGRATFEMVARGKTPREGKYGNDQSDKAAGMGATEEDDRLSCLAEKYIHKQRMYGDMMIQIH